MKLTVLIDNNTLIDRYFLGEPGVSYLISDSGTKILFDVGYSDAFITHAKKISGDDGELDIIGGFHLLNPPAVQLEGTAEYMKSLNPGTVHACHCTDLQSKIELSKVVNLKEVGVGLTLEY